MTTALITGVTGQTGSYLADLLVKKGYDVHGIVRRGSTINTDRINHLIVKQKIMLHYGDLADANSLVSILMKVRPAEVYNIGSQSHVRVSFDIPEYTAQVTGLGPLRILEALRSLNMIETRYLQASSSEMFGLSPPPQSETTPMLPISPYGCSKLFAYHMTRLYRFGYHMFACNSICFNHESILKNSPVIIHGDDSIDILPIEDLFRSKGHKYEGIMDEYKNKKIWTGETWTKILGGTCYQEQNKKVKLIQTTSSCYEATEDHVSFDEKKEIKTKDWKVDDKAFDCFYPPQNDLLHGDKEIDKFLGFLVGDGHISKVGRIQLTGVSKDELIEIASLITKKYGWTHRLRSYGHGKYKNCKKDIWQLTINNDRNFGLWLRKQIYTLRSNEKRVPFFILNSNAETKKAFFDGYYLADGRNKGNESYAYKGFTTSSATLCLGLNYIFKSFSDQEIKTKCEMRNGRRYYYTQYRTDVKNNVFGAHLKKSLNQVIKIVDTISDDSWFYDIQTESQTFATGPNLFKIHNSPRRAETFVTKKIVRGAVRIKLGLQDEIHLGNMDAKRDWGHAKDYAQAQYMIMNHSIPDDFVVATEDYHSVKDFLELVFKKLDLDYAGHIIIENKYWRPNEVPELKGDATKIHDTLGWKPTVSFDQLIDEMITEVMAEEHVKAKTGTQG